jgi:hypothetical protein
MSSPECGRPQGVMTLWTAADREEGVEKVENFADVING